MFSSESEINDDDTLSLLFICNVESTEKFAPVITMVLYKAFRVEKNELVVHACNLKKPVFSPLIVRYDDNSEIG